jgi:hypothetical protein
MCVWRGASEVRMEVLTTTTAGLLEGQHWAALRLINVGSPEGQRDDPTGRAPRKVPVFAW